MVADIEYDPATRITAGELRSMGMNIDPKIPDCAHTNRVPHLVSCKSAEPSGPNVIALDLQLQYDPFQWIELSLTITKKPEL